MTRRRKVALAALGVLAAPWVALWVWSLFVPLPPELDAGAYDASVRVLDRRGVLLRHVRTSDHTLGLPVTARDVGPDVVDAVIAAEDRRFRLHPGVDPLAVVRAAATSIARGRVVSGASTLTQQLARTLVPRPKTLFGKWSEMALALRIERSLSKDRILAEYLSRVPFAPNVRGIEAASRTYFDKAARDLSPAEAATLAGLPRGPSLYDPRKRPERVRQRRDLVLGRMPLSDERRRTALAEPLRVTEARPPALARHFVEHAVRDAPRGELATTLDAALQREAEVAARRTVEGLRARKVGSAAVVVLDNATGEVLAWVGSPDADDRAAEGANDGVLALRQPGSALKPFVYELGMERDGMTAATVLPDVPRTLLGPRGEYRLHDYDGRYRGPVRVREALASSLNMPAALLAERLGPGRVLERLHALGFESLDRDAEAYGPGLALGDGEVRLLDLANAYATLARGGTWRAPVLVRGALTPPPSEVLSREASAIVLDVLSDDAARAAGFGRRGVLDLPFPVAVKTGTSSGYRDNVTVGVTRRLTVAVWVGNMDGSPMDGVSGVTGAGPLFREIMIAATARYGEGGPLVEALPGEERVAVCALSGERAGAFCPHAVRERFASGTAPRGTCAWHHEHGETLPPEYADWARAAGRAATHAPGDGPRVVEPTEGTHIQHDASLGDREAFLIRTEGADDVARVILDGRALPRGPRAGTAFMRPTPGRHEVWVESGGRASPRVAFLVE